MSSSGGMRQRPDKDLDTRPDSQFMGAEIAVGGKRRHPHSAAISGWPDAHPAIDAHGWQPNRHDNVTTLDEAAYSLLIRKTARMSFATVHATVVTKP